MVEVRNSIKAFISNREGKLSQYVPPLLGDAGLAEFHLIRTEFLVCGHRQQGALPAKIRQQQDRSPELSPQAAVSSWDTPAVPWLPPHHNLLPVSNVPFPQVCRAQETEDPDRPLSQ